MPYLNNSTPLSPSRLPHIAPFHKKRAKAVKFTPHRFPIYFPIFLRRYKIATVSTTKIKDALYSNNKLERSFHTLKSRAEAGHVLLNMIPIMYKRKEAQYL